MTTTWHHWINLLLGIWVILSAYTNFTPGGLTTDLTITGLIITMVAVWGALAESGYIEESTLLSRK